MEMQVALHRQLEGTDRTVLLPVLLEHVDVPPLLRHLLSLDMTDGDVDRGIEQLATAMRHHQARQDQR
jgi:hypothetical protein